MIRVKIAFGILAAVVLYCGFAWYFVGYGSGRIIELAGDIEDLYEKGDYLSAENKAEELNIAASAYAERAGLMVHDNRLTQMTVSASKIKAFIKGRSDETYAELESIREDIEDFKKAEIPTLYTIL
ncbi:MAG: DUF4363 family protein [Ruminococcus sp.]|jgi:hypothetical protein|nr:DUF4363 family protein [Ruminococcus sp.]